MKTREGDLLQIENRLIFDVKGLVHPLNKVVAFPRYIPDPAGNRKCLEVRYRKIYSISDRYKFLKRKLSHYLVADPFLGELLCEVPKNDVKTHFKPINHLRKLRQSDSLDELETKALSFLEILQQYSGVPWNKLGISGSLLAKLHSPKSDIDPVVYGTKNCCKVHETLESLQQNRKTAVKAYTMEELKFLHDFRSKDTKIPFNDFVKTERRKTLQGTFQNQDYFIRCIIDWPEIKEKYGDIVYRKVGHAKIKAVITEASEAIFTPCRYSITNVQLINGKKGRAVTEIVSFRGRFCEQAKKGESIIAQGKVEKVENKSGFTSFRLLLGARPSDFMLLET